MTIEKRYVVFVGLTIAANLVAFSVSWYGVKYLSWEELNPFALFSLPSYFLRVIAVVGLALVLLRYSCSKRNIVVGMVLGAMSADGLMDVTQLLFPHLSRFGEYLAFAAPTLAAAGIPAAVALGEVRRLRRLYERNSA